MWKVLCTIFIISTIAVTSDAFSCYSCRNNNNCTQANEFVETICTDGEVCIKADITRLMYIKYYQRGCIRDRNSPCGGFNTFTYSTVFCSICTENLCNGSDKPTVNIFSPICCLVVIFTIFKMIFE